MKKVCIIDLDMTVVGGVEKVTAQLADQLSQWFELSVVSLRKEHAHWAYSMTDHVSLFTFTEGKGNLRIRQMIRFNWKPLRNYIRQQHIDLVLFMGTYAGFVGSIICQGLDVKTIFCDHGALMNQWDERSIRFLRYIAAKRSSHLVTLTEQTKEDYREKFHLPRQKIDCIYNGIDKELMNNRKPYAIQSKKILSAGRFSKEKGYDMLVEVARIILPKHPDWEWHVYGTGETYQEILEKRNQYRLEKQLILKGQVSPLYDLYAQYAMLVLPSYREGLPLILLEAKAAGLPMVSFDVMTGPREIIQNGKDGYLVPEKNIEAMAEAIEKLIQDPKLRETFSVNTQNELDKFNLDNIIAQWKSLIDQMLDE